MQSSVADSAQNHNYFKPGRHPSSFVVFLQVFIVRGPFRLLRCCLWLSKPNELVQINELIYWWKGNRWRSHELTLSRPWDMTDVPSTRHLRFFPLSGKRSGTTRNACEKGACEKGWTPSLPGDVRFNAALTWIYYPQLYRCLWRWTRNRVKLDS